MNGEKETSDGFLENLLHHRWAVPALSTLHAHGGGAKLIALQRALEVSRDSLKRALKSLIVSGLVAKNPGYGHPMRPEYVLTPTGKGLGPVCGRLMAQLARLDLEEIGLKKWSLPVAFAIRKVGGRFNGIRNALPSSTPRALSGALRDLQDAGIVTRFLVDDDPPRTEYSLTRRGKLLVRLLSELVDAMK